MVYSIFGFAWLFSLVYCLYTHKIAVKRLSKIGLVFTGVFFSLLCGILLTTALLYFRASLVRALLALAGMLGCATVELLYCLQLNEQLFGKYRRALHLVKLYHRGLLLPMPYHQGEELYWIDHKTPLPCVRKMYFVVAVSGCYIGIYQDNRQLVITRQVFVSQQMARMSLTEDTMINDVFE